MWNGFLKQIIVLTILGFYNCTQGKINNSDITKTNMQMDTSLENIDESIKNMIDNITWFGQSSVKIIAEDKIIYIDPYNLKENDQADLIFITHSHFDHLSVDDIKKIATDNTKIYAPTDCIEKLSSEGYLNLTEIEPGKTFETEGFQVQTVPAYNITKSHLHTKTNKWVGYILTINNVKIYHPGDTERIPEMKDINCDIAFMCLGQTYTMNAVEDAASAVLDVKAKVAIPFHYGMYEGTKNDAIKFKEILSDKVVVIIKE